MARREDGEPHLLTDYRRFSPTEGPFPPSNCGCLPPPPVTSTPALVTSTTTSTTTTTTTPTTDTMTSTSSGRTHVNQFRIFSANNCYNNPYNYNQGSDLPLTGMGQGGAPPCKQINK